MAQGRISTNNVGHVLTAGQVIEDYPNDTPYPSRLLLGWPGTRPIHVVVAENTVDREQIVITAYEPDAALWSADFRRRL